MEFPRMCARCGGAGFLNIEQLPDYLILSSDFIPDVSKWLSETKELHDVCVCDCCGDGEDWYGEPGYHYSDDDAPGTAGPYAYNGGLCECH